MVFLWVFLHAFVRPFVFFLSHCHLVITGHYALSLSQCTYSVLAAVQVLFSQFDVMMVVDGERYFDN